MKGRSLWLAVALAAAAMSGPALAADAAKGKKVFNKCKACHSLKAGKNKVGPHLSGIFGREAGSVEGYKYSKAMKASGIVWGEEEIAAYVASPRKYIPKNKMAFAGLKKQADIDNLMAYLKKETQ